MDRRTFVQRGSAAAIGLALGGCSTRRAPPTLAARRAVRLVPPDVSWDRIIRTTVGLRPHRPSGFLLRADRLDDRTVIHNYGHGGAGMSLAWGTAHLAAELALEHPARRAAVIGCGIAGLTSARILQRRGFDVTIYAASLPPETTSNMSWAGFTPMSGLVRGSERTPAWDRQFRRAVDIAYREHQRLVGRGYGVSWIDEFEPTDRPPAASEDGAPGQRGAPDDAELGGITLGPDEHPFSSRYVRWVPTLRFEPNIYLGRLVDDVMTFGGEIVVRRFDTPNDLTTLPETLIVNCTGLGARALFGDEELTPVKGQLIMLVPQPEVTFTSGGMLPRSDGIALGHVIQRGEWSMEVDEEEQRRVMERAIRTFGGMQAAPPDLLARIPRPRNGAPPVEAFFDRRS